MKKIISILIVLIIIYMPVTANALTDKEKQEIEEIKKNNENAMKQIEEMQKQVEKAKLENQKQLEELKKKSESKAATANKPAPEKVEKYNPKDYSKYIPKKDSWKIGWIPKKAMDDNELKKYLKDIHSKVEHALPKDAKKNAEQIIKEVKKQYPNDNTALANAANGCWITKHPAEALYIMGIACNNNPSDPDNLNNYAAFITMSGAPEKAIPILNKLNSQYPNNSTVLNNLGQAWFDLGDTQQAEKYLDGAIKAFAYHTQANYTKSIIEAARGNQTQAIAAMKRSIKRGYSKNKEHMLTKLGGKLDESDLNFPMPQDPLGLEKFVLPPYPQGTGDIQGLSQKWEGFRQQCSAKKEELQVQEMKLKQKLDAQHDVNMQDFAKIKQEKKNSDPKTYVTKMTNLFVQQAKMYPPLYSKAMAKLRIEHSAFAGWDEADYKKYLEKEEEEKKFFAEIESMKEAWSKGEQSCAKDNNYIKMINAKYEARNTEYIEKLRKTINTDTYYMQYAVPGGDDAVEIMKISQKEQFLGELAALPVILEGHANNCGSGGEYTKTTGQLADFYDLHCDHHISGGIPGVWNINVACNKMTTEFNALPFLKGNWTENLDTNQIMSGEALIGLSTGIGDGVEMGPLKAEAKIGGGAFIEFDNNGITDYGPYAELKGEIGMNWEKGEAADPYEVHIGNTKVSAGDLPSAEVGVHARYGINSGMISANSTGLLEGAFNAKW